MTSSEPTATSGEVPPEAQTRSAAEVETAFLTGVEARLERAKGTLLHGSWWTTERRSEEYRLRQWVRSRDELAWLPKNKRLTLTGWRRTFWLGKRPRSIAIASVLSLLERHAQGEADPPPIGLVDLQAHVQGLVQGIEAPCIVGVCSPSGFTDEARQLRWPTEHVKLVLVEPDASHAWRVTPGSANLSADVLALFDPESAQRKIERVCDAIESRSAALIAGGLTIEEIASGAGVTAEQALLGIRRAMERDPSLKLSNSKEGRLLYRGAPSVEESSMSMMDRIRQMLGGEGNEARKINVLAERRARLVEQRDKLYADIAVLESQEAELMSEGRATTSASVKKRVATQIKQLRDEMGRLNAKARVLGQQVDVISTHVHNLTLIQQGKRAKLPTQEELTQDAVRAEEMLEQLATRVDLAAGLDMGEAETSLSGEEASILAELEMPEEAAPEDTEEDPEIDAIVNELEEEPPPEKTKPREPEAG